MRRWSIGARLTFWYSLVLLVGLALFAAGIWVVVAHSLKAAMDETLAAQAKGVATVLQSEYNPSKPEQLREELSEYAAATPGGNLIEVRDSRGDALIESRVLAAAGRSRRHYRTLTTEVSIKAASYRIVVATPLEGAVATLRSMRELLLLATPGVLLIASLGGYWMSRRALKPVDAITRAAQTIGIENLSQRLEVPSAGDELQRLSETWNSMLERLEGSGEAIDRNSRPTRRMNCARRSP